MSGPRYNPRRARALAGVGDQNRCPHGNADCSGPGGPGLPCLDCLAAGGGGDGSGA